MASNERGKEHELWDWRLNSTYNPKSDVNINEIIQGKCTVDLVNK